MKRFGTIGTEKKEFSFTKANTILINKQNNNLIPQTGLQIGRRLSQVESRETEVKAYQLTKLKKIEENNEIREIHAKKRSLMLVLASKQPTKKQSQGSGANRGIQR